MKRDGLETDRQANSALGVDVFSVDEDKQLHHAEHLQGATRYAAEAARWLSRRVSAAHSGLQNRRPGRTAGKLGAASDNADTTRDAKSPRFPSKKNGFGRFLDFLAETGDPPFEWWSLR